MPSAIGTLANLDAQAAVGPVFYDKITMVGDAAYPTGGTLGLMAKLRTLRGDSREIRNLSGYGSAAGYSLRYTPPVYDTDGVTVLTADKLQVFLEDQTSGVVAEVANTTNLSGITFTLQVVSN